MTSTKKQNVVWRTYPDYPFIQANQFGEIRTKERYLTNKNGVKRHYKEHFLKQRADKDGYMIIDAHENGRKATLKVHRIVATCFLPNPDNLPQVNHKDNNPKNNSVSNLEWCTTQYNTAYKEKYGTSAKEAAKALRKPMFAVNLKTLEKLYFKSQHEAANQLNIDQTSIIRVAKGRQKQAGGYWFCYADENAVEKIREKFGDEVAS